MIRHRWSIACARAVVDRYTNSLSLEHIIERINIQGPLPTENAIPIELDIMTLWATDEPGDSEIAQSRLTIVAPDGEELGSNEAQVDLTKHVRLRNRVHLSGLPFSGCGQYVIRVDLLRGDTWETVGNIYIDIVQIDPVEQEESQEQA